ncbi:MAG: GTPase HflX [Zetaproteobacteria bacterium CG_4_9_14_3_um_filter_49_83]|nr:MAG: GTPase HflX [Zetaproteobacteria bacterium CG1_02_49_23]PIQ33540.1 MAG: GTPase HflX [Zetaproteobacteria bacterium CG17_big_fil_post_rev_8_21_14_2_50_50_13]PIV29585.1 MAG: GTPase HflX [Zetaproteobacteria bacterium CG02_land_8_20_14_3_00_50_9]PIY56368.1 MAG: GTPase HflX [Zetaproteobacteria bacterium CG_4_10_14_0_8_um_filter_49_80]PJA34765.1 MAG: GTPase HflX [Zetaproteobacteria bacterium CG_4_9_14_3_um_filter_49_83]
MIETELPIDRALAVHPRLAKERWGEFASISRKEEFERLVEAGGCSLQGSELLPVRKAVAATLMGSGQAEDVKAWVEAREIDVVFVDHQLSPVQQRNLEETWGAKVVDRTGLILEIFASRARTREGVLQVELASLNYQLGRLVRSWTHLERQRGGFGFMGGPGERQIELDRRMIRNSIGRLERELMNVRKMRATQRAGRQRKDIPTIALVGYTNAGKSTLFNRLTDATVYVADQLFATLDSTLRLLPLEGGGRLMLSDTVGFVQDLPHELVDAFRSTLEEVVEADLILHVRDVADPENAKHKAVVEGTLRELGLDGDAAPPIVEVLNKVDLAPNIQSTLREGVDGSRVAVSARNGQGMDELLNLLRGWAERDMVTCELDIAHSDSKKLAWCHQVGRVLEQQADETGTRVKVILPRRHADKVNPQPDEDDFDD